MSVPRETRALRGSHHGAGEVRLEACGGHDGALPLGRQRVRRAARLEQQVQATTPVRRRRRDHGVDARAVLRARGPRGAGAGQDERDRVLPAGRAGLEQGRAAVLGGDVFPRAVPQQQRGGAVVVVRGGGGERRVAVVPLKVHTGARAQERLHHVHGVVLRGQDQGRFSAHLHSPSKSRRYHNQRKCVMN